MTAGEMKTKMITQKWAGKKMRHRFKSISRREEKNGSFGIRCSNVEETPDDDD